MPALVPGMLAVGLFLVWAVHNGGYDEDTWYWGALAAPVLLVAVLIARGPLAGRPSPLALAGLVCFALYVGWSYLSILWAQSQGTALEGSNRALLYLLLYAVLAYLPSTAESVAATLLAFAGGIGVIAVVLLVRLAAGDHVQVLFIGGRLAAPTGYINSTAALFTIGALMAIALTTRRELYAPVRGLLLGFAAADLDLAVIVQSRGWLFTLPLVALVAILVLPDRLRMTAAAGVSGLATLIPIRRLLAVYVNTSTGRLSHLAAHAGRPALLLCFVAFVVGTLLAWADQKAANFSFRSGVRRLIGVALATVAVAGVGLGLEIVSNSHPARFISEQWHGFAHEEAGSSNSHFAAVGSGRYDFWRVALDAFEAHPVGGIGQDNFDDYYIKRGRSGEEPAWPHSLEMRLLAMTGIVGFLLFFAFLALSVAAAIQSRRRGPPLARAGAAIALLPLIDWLIHGSIDWFWEIPALCAPALGFLAVAGSISRIAGPPDAMTERADDRKARRSRRVRAAGWLAACVGLLGAATVLVLPYLSVREVSIATDVQATDPAAALADLKTAAELNPLDSGPGRLAGTIALREGDYRVARERFRQSIEREPGGWFGWLGAGLVASELGDRDAARRDFTIARSIDRRQQAIQVALERVDSRYPLTPSGAFKLLTVAS